MAKRNKNMLNLRIRGRQFQFFKRLSAPLAAHFGQTFRIKNLNTSDLIEAQIRRDEILLGLKKLETQLQRANPHGIDINSKESAVETAWEFIRLDCNERGMLADHLESHDRETGTEDGYKFWQVASGKVVPCVTHLDRFLRDADVTARVGRQRRREVERFAEWLGTDRDDLRRVDRKLAAEYCEYLRHERGLTRRSSNLTVSHVSSYFKWLNKVELIKGDSPFARLQEGGAKSQQRRIPLSRDEVVQLAAACGPNDDLQYAIKIAALQGMRAIEVTGVKVGDCRPDRCEGRDGCMHISRSKTDAGIRTMPVHHQLDLSPLLLNRQDDEWLLRTYRGNEAKLSKDFSILHKTTFGEQERVGRLSPKTYHSFRHGWITDRSRANCDRVLIKRLAGHDLGSEGVNASVYDHGASDEQLVQVLNAARIEGL